MEGGVQDGRDVTGTHRRCEPGCPKKKKPAGVTPSAPSRDCRPDTGSAAFHDLKGLRIRLTRG
jgi:hypothetical protein